MIKCKINNISYEFKPNLTIMQACSSLNIDIPRFCFHDRLSIAGNCRMCLVEVKNSPKPVASCAMPLMNNMEILTNTLSVKKAREGVLEFLLINHPLDCPICDQGSECDLQDQAMVYGSDRGRFYETKRAVEDKDCGPLVKTIMTRCIHCTRCIRFTTEVAGVPVFGLTGRGSKIEVGTYVEGVINSELSGNIIDLCPVGALTSKPFAFTARAWELTGVDSIDVFDALGSNIRIDSRGAQVMRVLPRVNDLVNDEWISDKVRFSYDGLNRQRLLTPFISAKNGLVSSDWLTAVQTLRNALVNIYEAKGEVVGHAGPTTDLESIVVLKDFLTAVDPLATLTSVNAGTSFDFRDQYLFNFSPEDLEKTDVCLLIGCNAKIDSPVFNSKLRKHFLQNDVLVASVGNTVNLGYNFYHLGNDLTTLSDIAEGRHWFCTKLAKAKLPLIIVGEAVLERQDASDLFLFLQNFSLVLSAVNKNLSACTVNVMPNSASFAGSMDLGFSQTVARKNNVNVNQRFIYALDSLEPLKHKRPGDFIVYQGHHGHELLSHADVVLPGCTFIEKDGHFVNMLGMVQKSRFVSKPAGEAREDWKVLVFVMLEVLNHFKSVSFNAPSSILSMVAIYNESSLSKGNFMRERLSVALPHLLAKPSSFSLPLGAYSLSLVNNAPVLNATNNYYMTDSVSSSSSTMSACTEQFVLPVSNYKKL